MMGRFLLSTIRGRLLLLVAIATIPTVILIFYSWSLQREQAVKEAHLQAQLTARQVAFANRTVFEQAQTIVGMLGRDGKLLHLPPARCNETLAEAVNLNGRFAYLRVVDLHGKILCSNESTIMPLSMADMVWYQQVVRSAKPAVGTYQLSRATGTPVLVFAAPLADEQGQISGVVALALRLDWLNEAFARAGLPEDSALLLLDQQETVLARYPEPQFWMGHKATALLEEAELTLQGDEGMGDATGLDGIRRIYGFVRVDRAPNGDIYLLVGTSLQQTLAREQQKIVFYLTVVLTVAAVVVLLAWLAADRLVVRYVNLLVDSARRLSAGDLSARVEETDGDELTVLATTFNSMAVSLQEQLTRIQRLNRVYAVLSGINSAIVRIREQQALLEESCYVAVVHGNFSYCWIGMLGQDGRVEPSAWGGRSDDYLVRLRKAYGGGLPREGWPPQIAVQEGLHYVCNDVAAAVGVDAIWRELVLSSGFRSMVVLPIRAQGKVAGVIVLYAAEAGFFDEEEMVLLDEVAGDIGLGLEVINNELELHYYAYYDRVTGLPNRSLFIDRTDQALSRARHDKRVMAVAVVGVHDMRRIKESFGRHAGDRVLQETGRLLAGGVRDGDVVAKIGGSAFAIVYTAVARPDDIDHLASRLVDSFPLEIQVDEGIIAVSATVGVAIYPESGGNGTLLLEHAEAAQHQAESEAMGVAFFSMEASKRAQAHLILERELMHALQHEEFSLVYQPVVDTVSRQIVAAESLMRWHNGRLGDVAPAIFIPVLEEMGLIGQVGWWALEQCVRQLVRWRAVGHGAVRLSVNVSMRQLQTGDFSRRVSELLRSTGLEGLPLAVELTESQLMAEPETIIGELAALRDAGITLYVDDFGTGYSSLSYLQRLPLDVLKIDRSFVEHLGSSHEAVNIAEAVVAIAHKLGMEVVAEGVEVEEQRLILASMGCDYAQGYLFAKPLELAAIDTALARGVL